MAATATAHPEAGIPSGETLVEVNGLCKTYGPLAALEDVSFSVRRGEVFGLLGRNGSGKTTLLRILTTYRLPTAGSARIAGLDIVRDALSVRRRIGYMPEHPQLYRDLTVSGYLRLYATLQGIPGRKRDARVREVVERFGLVAVEARLVGHCSKGYRSRIALAAAVMHGPDVIFLDEPTDGLDPEQRARTREEIRGLARTSAVVLSTHDLSEAASVCSRLLVLDRGRVVRVDTVEGFGGPQGILEVFRQTRERVTEQDL